MTTPYLYPLVSLYLANPPEALGVHLVQQCDQWQVNGRLLAKGKDVDVPYADILTATTRMVEKLMTCQELFTVNEGRRVLIPLDELNRAGYKLDLTESAGYPGKAIYALTHDGMVLISGVCQVPVRQLKSH